MSDEHPTERPRRILLAEDSADVVLIIRRLLEKEGHEIISVQTADEVLPAVIREQPDLLLLDVMMPSEEGLDGFAICQRIRETAHHRRLPIVILSAIAQGTGRSDEEMRRLSGADAFIHKPFEVPHLLETVRSLLPR
jgi:CheY-like chemotaxis protein